MILISRKTLYFQKELSCKDRLSDQQAVWTSPIFSWSQYVYKYYVYKVYKGLVPEAFVFH